MSCDGTTGCNWLSGHWGSKVGVAFHQNWLTPYLIASENSDDWILSSDQNDLYRAQGVDVSVARGGNPSFVSPLAINKYGAELSDWAVAMVLVYSRTLSLSEITQIERWLYSVYFNRSSISSNKAYRLYPNC